MDQKGVSEKARFELEIQELREENRKLKKALHDLVPIVEKKKKAGEEITPEETICHLELSKILLISMERELDLNETKKLDLLEKNLYILQGKTPRKKKQSVDKKISEAELLHIVENES